MKPIAYSSSKANKLRASTIVAKIAAAIPLVLVLFLPSLAYSSGDHGENHAEGETAFVGNELCPVLPDEVIDPNINAEFDGKTIYFCCKSCRRDFLAKPEMYLANLDNETNADAMEPPPDNNDHHEQVAPTGHNEENAAHDHATDHAGSPGTGPGIVELAGRFHPLAVHFPIGLLIFAFILELICLAKPADALRQGARLALIGGAVSALGAVILGWFAGIGASYPGLESTLQLHRWIGSSTALLSTIALMANELAHRGNKRFKPAYLIALFACSVLVGTAGHLGATLIYGPDYLPF